MSRTRIAATLTAAAVITTALTPAASAAPDRPTHEVRLLGERIVPNDLVFQGTTVGGLSSIDYDPRTGGYVFICDDRSAMQAARFYTAKFDVGAKGVGPVTFTGTHPFRRPDGTTYPPLAENDPSRPQNERTVDPEELRADPWTGDYFWSQEGERTATTLIDPSIRRAGRDGAYVRDLPLPANEKMIPGAGPRQNLAIEGLTFAGLGSLIASSVEGPMLQDGPDATPEHGGLDRITVQSRFGPVLAQYAYPEEKVFAAPNPPGAFATTGISSLLAADPVDPSKFLVMERSFVTGVGNKLRIYEMDTKGATNVLGVKSLAGAKNVKPVRKRLVADLADFPLSTLSTVDNVEGMTWGPRLPSGERTLVLVSDNNFSATQVTQLIALAIR
ncbi:esterase-like activity of phytase family protein [Amycolatopsis minnesotensis]